MTLGAAGAASRYVFDVSAIEHVLHRVFIGKEGTTLRLEEKQKAREAAALLEVVAQTLARTGRSKVPTLVDAAAGKAYIGLLAAELILAPGGRGGRVVAIERDPRRAELARAAARRIAAPGITIDVVLASAGDVARWPDAPTLVVALHACGAASDEVIDAAIASGASYLLLAPCCVARSVSRAAGAEGAAEALGVPAHGLVRQLFAESFVASERTLRLEAAGYETEVASFVRPTVTPHHLLWRSRRVCEPGRMQKAAQRLLRLRALAGCSLLGPCEAG